MSKILTIIVPSYNTQAYIDTCIPTMLGHSQTAGLELMLVNDGSRDGTLEKLLRFGRRYPDIVTVIDKENGGHGSVINIGIQKAKGAYLKVVDGDDWVISKNLGKMIRQLKSCRADMVIHPYIQHDVRKHAEKTIRYGIETGRELLFDQAAVKLPEVSIQAVTYRTHLLREHQIRVREHCFYEDTEYNIFPVRHVETVCAYSNPVYVYRLGSDSQSVQPGQAFRNRAMHRMVVDDCIAYFEKNCCGMSETKREYIRRIINRRIRSQYMIYLKNRITAAQMQELIQWDLELKRKSAYFYRSSSRFPVNILRMDMRRAYPLLKRLYALYAAL